MRSWFEGVIATDQSKPVTTLGPTSALWRCTRPTPSALSRSSATKCDQPAFFLVFPTAADRDPRVRTGFSHAYSLPSRPDEAKPSILKGHSEIVERNPHACLSQLLCDQPSRRRPISLIDHTRAPCEFFSFFHTHKHCNKHGLNGPDPWYTNE